MEHTRKGMAVNKTIKNYLYILFVQCGNYIFPIITIPIVSRVFGPELIGKLNYVQYIIGYIVLFVNYSFNYTGIRRLTRAHERKNEIFYTIFFSQLLLLFIFSVGYFFFAKIIGGVFDNKLSWICYLTCLATVFQQTWIFQAFKDFKVITYVSLVSKLISVIFIVLIIKNKSDLFLYAWVLQLTFLGSSAFGFIYAIKKYNLKYEGVTLKKCIEYIKDDFYVFLSGILANLYTVTGVVLLGAMTNTLEVGLYTSAQKIVDLLRNILLLPLNMLFFPIISEAFKETKEKGITIFKSMMPVFILFSITSFICMIIFGKYIVLGMFGESFYGSINILRILSVGFVFLFIGTVLGSQLILNLNFDKNFVKMQILVATISLSLNVLTVKSGGGEMVAFTWTISEAVMTTMQILFLRKQGIKFFDLKYFRFSVLKESVRNSIRRG